MNLHLLTYSSHSNWDTIGGFARTATEFKTLADALYGTAETEGKIYEVRSSSTASRQLLTYSL